MPAGSHGKPKLSADFFILEAIIMFRQIEPAHPIFQSPAYRKDVVPFRLIEQIKGTAKLLISDEKSVIIASSLLPSLPAWVWTADGADEGTLAAAYEALTERCVSDKQAHFVSKVPVAEFFCARLLEDGFTAVSRLEMESYVCPKVIPAKNTDVNIEKAAAGDLDDIADFCRRFEVDCFGREMSVEKSRSDAEAIIKSPLSFVIRDGGRPAAMAKGTWENEIYAGVNGVYTRPKYRCRGYAAALVAHISERILADGKTPQLYADVANPASNKAYRNIGFVPCGRVVECLLKRDE